MTITPEPTDSQPDPSPSGPSAETDQLVALLAQHEARWTTHGWQRTYHVMHCAGDCDWSLRQKALMSDDYCYELHRQHVAEQIAALSFPHECDDLEDAEGDLPYATCRRCDSDEKAQAYRFRWTTECDVFVNVTATDEEAAYDQAFKLARARLEQIAAARNGVEVHLPVFDYVATYEIDIKGADHD